VNAYKKKPKINVVKKPPNAACIAFDLKATSLVSSAFSRYDLFAFSS